MGKPNPNSFHQKVLSFVLGRTTTTTADVFAAMGGEISAARAAMSGHGEERSFKNLGRPRQTQCKNQAAIIRRGKKRIISDALCKLTQTGKLRRIAPSTYAAPLKIFCPEEKAG